MAWVWCAQDRTLDRNVAIKLLAEPFAHDELAGRRFKREARAAARLSGHANVVTIYDVGQGDPSEDNPHGRPFIVMEYLAGGTVASALREGRVDQATSLRWLREASAALDFAHRRGVIHRDVKLANFLLDRDRVLHVADFGIAQLGTEDTLTVTGEVIGTAAYLAPERALGQPATEASDRYALAVAAFELLVGARPFTAEHFAAQARQHVEEPPPLASQRNPELPSALDAVLTRGMAKKPEERFATAAQFADAVEAALAATSPARPLAAAAGVGGLASGPAASAIGLGATPARSRARAAAAAAGSPGQAPIRTYGARRGRIAAFAALAAVLIGVAVAAAASNTSAPVHTAATGHARVLGHRQAARRHAAASKPAPAAAKPSTTASRTPTSPTPPAKQPSRPPTGGPDALEAQGHQLMAGGDYTTAIPILRQAVAAASPASLTYAYALYDLGRSLRLAGDARAAVQVLWERLQIPNQTGVVRTELALALRALGQSQQSGGGAPLPSNGQGHQGNHPSPPPAGGQGD
jgi:serine/threonine-protein kinase